jgi:hypothetical protein
MMMSQPMAKALLHNKIITPVASDGYRCVRQPAAEGKRKEEEAQRGNNRGDVQFQLRFTTVDPSPTGKAVSHTSSIHQRVTVSNSSLIPLWMTHVVRIYQSVSEKCSDCLRGIDTLTFPPTPFLSHTGRGRGNAGCVSERTLATSHAIVARVRYVPNEKSGFFDQALSVNIIPNLTKRLLPDVLQSRIVQSVP